MYSREEETVLLLLDKPTIRKNKIYELLDQNNLRQIESKEKDPADILQLPFYEIDYIMVNVHSSSFEKIILSAQKYYPQAIFISIYDKNNTDNYYNKIRNGVNLDYFVEGNTLTLKYFSDLMERIRESKAKIFQMNKTKEENVKERFAYVAHLGTGANAIVDLYKDNELKRLVALKRINIGRMKTEQKNKIIKELNAMKALSVPTILTIYDYQIINNEQFIYLEYAREGTLEKKICETEDLKIKISHEQILEWIAEILLGLFALNKNNIIHQDIKPVNILITDDNTAKLSDFGFFKIVIDESKGTIFKNNHYVSPELASNTIFSFNTDIWSLGIIAYELVTGKKPFSNQGEESLLELIKKGKIKTISESIPLELEGLIDLMLVRNPSLRYDAEELVNLDIIHDRLLALYEVKRWNKDSEVYKNLIKKGKRIFYKTFKPLQIEEIKMLEISFALFKETLPYNKNNSLFNLFGNTNSRYGDELYKTMIHFILNNREIFPNMKGNLLDKQTLKMEAESILTSLIQAKIISNQASGKIEQEIFLEDNTYVLSYEIDNNHQNSEIIEIGNIPDYYDLNTISRYALYIGQILFQDLNNEKITYMNTNYLNFLSSISYFSHFSFKDLPYDETIATLLNVYQVMYIHIAINKANNKSLKVNSLFENISKFWDSNKSQPEVIYKFKDTNLSNQEIKHVIFRGNKRPEGNLTRLAYSNSYITKILPNFVDLKPLFILYDYTEEFQPLFKSFETRRVEQQLEETVINFIEAYITIDEGSITLPLFLKPLLADFGTENTDFLKFISKHYKNNFEKDQLYRIPISSDNISLVTNITNILSKLRSGKLLLNFK